MSIRTFWAEWPPQRPCPGRSELPIKGRLEESLCEGPPVRIARARVLAPEDLVSLRFFAQSCWGPQLITSGRGKCLQTGHPAGWKVTPLKVWRRRGPTEDLRPPCQTASWSKWPRPACHQLTVRLPVSLAPSVPSPALSALRVVLRQKKKKILSSHTVCKLKTQLHYATYIQWGKKKHNSSLDVCLRCKNFLL